jgi:hypothetical protein
MTLTRPRETLRRVRCDGTSKAVSDVRVTGGNAELLTRCCTVLALKTHVQQGRAHGVKIALVEVY